MQADLGKMGMRSWRRNPTSRNDGSAPPKFKLILKSSWIAPSPAAVPNARLFLRKIPRDTMTCQGFPYKTFRPALQDCRGLENSAGHVQLWVVLDANYLDYRLGNYSRSTGGWRAGGEAPCLVCLEAAYESIFKLSTEKGGACVSVWGDSATPHCKEHKSLLGNHKSILFLSPPARECNEAMVELMLHSLHATLARKTLSKRERRLESLKALHSEWADPGGC